MNSPATPPTIRPALFLFRLLAWWKTWSREWEPSLFFEAPYALPSAKLRKQRLLVTRLFWLHTSLCAMALLINWLYL